MKYIGREAVLKVGGASVASARSLSMEWSLEEIDTTTKGDSGQRTFRTAYRNLTVTMDGVWTNETYDKLLYSYMEAGTTFAAEIVTEAGESWAGDWIITTYSRSLPYDEVDAYNMTLRPATPITYTAAP